MNTLTTRLRKSIALFSISALLSTLVVVAPASAAWYDSSVAKLGDASYQTMTAEQKEALLSAASSRQDAAVVLHRALDNKAATITELTFTDKAAVAPYATAAVLYLYEQGIVKGNPDGTFMPTAPLNRAEFVVMLDRAGLLGDDLAATTPAVDAEFVGVEWAKPAFQKAAKDGIVQGYPDGTWRPAGAVNKAEAFVLSDRATGGVTTPPSEGGTPGRDTSFNPNGSSQGSIESVELGSRDETEALEGEEEVEIYAVDVETDTDGPLEVQSVDAYFSSDDTVADASTKPWDYFEEVSLAVEGKVVATVDAGSASDWSDKTSGNIDAADTTNEYRIRFTGLEEVLPSDETTKISVLVTVKDALDSDDENAIWWTKFNQFRVMDESGLVTNYNDDLDVDVEESFDLDEEETADLDFSVAAEEVEATTVEVSESADTNEVTIFAFEVEEENGIGADLTEMTLTFTATTAGLGALNENNVMKRAYIYQDGKKVGDETMTNGGVVVFDNMSARVDGDETAEFTVVVDIEDTNDGVRYAEGALITVAVTSLDEVQDDNGNDEDDIAATGLALTSETHELRSEGLMFEFVSAVQDKSFIADDADENDEGTFEVTFKATAFGDDMRLDRSCEETDGNLAGQGVEFTITGAASNSTVCDLTSASSDSEDTVNTYEVDKNTSRTFTLKVVATASAAHFAEVSIASFNWGTATNNTNANYYTFNLEDYKTGSLSLKIIPGA